MHLHYGLLADILVELAKSLSSRPELDEQRATAPGAVATLVVNPQCRP
jgi:hypothetical protein